MNCESIRLIIIFLVADIWRRHVISGFTVAEGVYSVNIATA